MLINVIVSDKRIKGIILPWLKLATEKDLTLGKQEVSQSSHIHVVYCTE